MWEIKMKTIFVNSTKHQQKSRFYKEFTKVLTDI